MSQNLVKVIASSEGTCLMTCSIEEIERAYQFAAEMEALGIEVEIQAPSLPETLGASLGASAEEQSALRRELDDEIDSHNSVCGSCTTAVHPSDKQTS
jgi:hypothetical protein